MTDLFIGLILGILLSISLSIVMYILNKNKKSKIRLNASMIKPGQIIKIEHDDAVHKICTAECISNDTDNKKLLIEILWLDETKKRYKQQYIIPYSSKELANFHLLNERDFKLPSYEDEIGIKDNSQSSKQEKIKQKIIELEEKLKLHIQKEEYEIARKVQDEIDSLKKN